MDVSWPALTGIASLLSIALSGIWLVESMRPFKSLGTPPPGTAEEFRILTELVSRWRDKQSVELRLVPPRLGPGTIGDRVQALEILGRPSRLLLHGEPVGGQVQWSIQLYYGAVVAHVLGGTVYALSAGPRTNFTVTLPDGQRIDSRVFTAELAVQALGPPNSRFTDHTETLFGYEQELSEVELSWTADGARLQWFAAHASPPSPPLPKTPLPRMSGARPLLLNIGFFVLSGVLLVALSSLPDSSGILRLYPVVPPTLALAIYRAAGGGTSK